MPAVAPPRRIIEVLLAVSASVEAHDMLMGKSDDADGVAPVLCLSDSHCHLQPRMLRKLERRHAHANDAIQARRLPSTHRSPTCCDDAKRESWRSDSSIFQAHTSNRDKRRPIDFF